MPLKTRGIEFFACKSQTVDEVNSMLKRCLFFLCLFICVLVLFSCAEDVRTLSRQELSEGVKARLGKGAVINFAYSPDGTRLSVTTTAGLYLHETATYREVALMPLRTDEIWSNVAFSPDSRSIAGRGFANRNVYVWDAKTGVLKHILAGHRCPVTRATFSPDSRTLATTSGDDTIYLWDIKTGRAQAHAHRTDGDCCRCRLQPRWKYTRNS